MSAPVLALQFQEPGRLWLLLLVAVLAVVHVVRQGRRASYAVRFTNLALLDSVAPSRPGWRRHLPAVLLLAALAGMIGALAEPTRPEQVPQERATVVVTIDTSLSMEATDIAPNRLVAAQDAAKEFIDELPERLNVALVSFNGVARVEVPPTTDRDQLIAAVDQLRLGERTAIGEAIFASLEAIRLAPPGEDGEEVPARIVLMSDGSTTVGRPDAQGSAAAVEMGVEISTIAFGTPGGTIEIDGQPGPIPVPVDIPALERIANDTGGQAYTATTGQQLRDVYEDIGSSVGFTTEDQDITGTFVGGSLVILTLAAVLSQLWFSRLP